MFCWFLDGWLCYLCGLVGVCLQVVGYRCLIGFYLLFDLVTW